MVSRDFPSLPVVDALPALQTALSEHDSAVLEAPPGAGKTTLVPLELLSAPWLGSQKILVLEPRRVAARAAAERMAQLLNEKPGDTVGYRMRLDRCVGDNTRIEVITEGMLTRQLQGDPALTDVGLVIFDEFHERSLEADLGLALSLQSRELFRDTPLKLLVMSATLDGDAVAQLLGDSVPVVRSQGRQFPVDIHWRGAGESRPESTHARAIAEAVGALVIRVLAAHSGNVLVFLPGQNEIRRTQQWLAQALKNSGLGDVHLWPMHGALDIKAQRQAIAPTSPGERKVVLATNVAQTSLTIEGITVVVDAGLQRLSLFNPGNGISRLVTRRASRADAEQRAGRAGRLAPGHCYRLWSEEEHRQLAPQAPPEIINADLTALALQLLGWGVDDPAQLSWLDAPPAGAFDKALATLRDLGAAIHTEAGVWQVTPHGERVSQLSASPRLAHMLVCGANWNLAAQAVELASVLMVGRPRNESSANLAKTLARLRDSTSESPSDRAWQRRIKEQSALLMRQLRRLDITAVADGSVTPQQGVAALLATAFPMRIARQIPGESSPHAVYQLASGRRVSVPADDGLTRAAWLAVAEVGAGDRAGSERVYSAVPLDERLFGSLLSDLVRVEESCDWDETSDRVRARREQKIGELVLHSEPGIAVPQEAGLAAMLQRLRDTKLSDLPWNDALRQWQARVVLLREHDNAQSHWPDVSDDALMATLEQWLAPALIGITSVQALQKIDLAGLLSSLLPWPLPRELDELAPQRWTVPSGSSIAIDYCARPPVLAVKLQEMFGCVDTPRIVRGSVALQLHLLSPARRPLQITQDLAGFWSGSYPDVKKDMKGRYPKHPWPDDPLQALPTAKTRHHKSS